MNLEKILNEERDERTFAKMEQQIAKSELSLRGMGDRERTWFQTMKQRKSEKDRLDDQFKAAEAAKNAPGKRPADNDMSKLSESKRKKKEEADKKKTPSQLAKQKIRDQQEKMSFLRAKASKIAHKTKRIRQVDDIQDGGRQTMKTKRPSKFAVDLTNTSRRNAKKLRFAGFVLYFIFSHTRESVIQYFLLLFSSIHRYDANSMKKMQKLNAKKRTSKVKIINKAGENKFNKGKNFGTAPKGKSGKKKK